MMEKIKKLLEEGSVSVPKTLLFHYRDLKMTEKELIFLLYLLGEDSLFNPKKASLDMHMSMNEVLEMIESLSGKDFIKIEVHKIGSIREERISLEGIYDKLAFLLVEDKVEVTEKSNLFSIFEKEFGRPLSPIEYEIIKGWMESHFSEELILCALKEAVYNGVFRMNYIDKILFEWNKKGIRTKEDVGKNNVAFNAKKNVKTEEVFIYDWLNENE